MTAMRDDLAETRSERLSDLQRDFARAIAEEERLYGEDRHDD